MCCVKPVEHSGRLALEIVVRSRKRGWSYRGRTLIRSEAVVPLIGLHAQNVDIMAESRALTVCKRKWRKHRGFRALGLLFGFEVSVQRRDANEGSEDNLGSNWLLYRLGWLIQCAVKTAYHC